VFLSHTSELREFPRGASYVAAAERAVSAAGHVIVDMADFPAADLPAAQLCADRVRGCEVYVGILGTRYGSPVRDKPEVSYTELEFDTATEAGLDRLVFLLDTDADDVGIPLSKLTDHEFGARQEAFRRRVQDSGLVTQSFASPAELGQLVERSLRDLAQGFLDVKTLRGASALLDVLAMRRAFFHGDRRFITDAAIYAGPGLSIPEMLKYLDAGRTVSVAYSLSESTQDLQDAWAQFGPTGDERVRDAPAPSRHPQQRLRRGLQTPRQRRLPDAPTHRMGTAATRLHG
jgi:hypothetical protein